MTKEKEKFKFKLKITKAQLGICLALIPLLGFAIFGLGPLVLSMIISFFKPIGYRLTDMTFVGFNNYISVIKDPLFIKSIGNTFYAMLSIPITMVLSLLIASALNSKRVKGKTFFRTVFFIPYVCSVVAISIMWKWMLDGEYGVINHMLSFVGIKGIDWLGNSKSFMPAMIIMSIWSGLGFNIILISASLTGVDAQLYEAADIDGAGRIAKFFKITLPQISPIIFFLLVTGVIGGLQDFARFQIMAPGGGPDNAGLTMVYYLYNAGFENIVTFGMGIASAVSWILTLIIGITTAINFYGSKKWVQD